MTETDPECVARVCGGVWAVNFQVGRGQNRTAPSVPPAMRASLDRNSTLKIALLLAEKVPRYAIWPLRWVYVAGTEYTYTLPSALPNASSRPSGLKASEEVESSGWKTSSSENPGTP